MLRCRTGCRTVALTAALLHQAVALAAALVYRLLHWCTDSLTVKLSFAQLAASLAKLIDFDRERSGNTARSRTTNSSRYLTMQNWLEASKQKV